MDLGWSGDFECSEVLKFRMVIMQWTSCTNKTALVPHPQPLSPRGSFFPAGARSAEISEGGGVGPNYVLNPTLESQATTSEARLGRVGLRFWRNAGTEWREHLPGQFCHAECQ